MEQAGLRHSHEVPLLEIERDSQLFVRVTSLTPLYGDDRLTRAPFDSAASSKEVHALIFRLVLPEEEQPDGT